MISFQLWNIDIGINKFLDCTAHPNKWQEKRERRGWYSDLFLLQYSYFWGWTPSFPLTEMHTCCVFWIYSFATTISTTTGLGPPVASHPPRLSPLLSYQFSHEGKQQQQKQNMQKKCYTPRPNPYSNINLKTKSGPPSTAWKEWSLVRTARRHKYVLVVKV